MPIYFTDRRFGLRIITKEEAGARILPESGTGIGILAVDKADSQPSVLHYCGTGIDSPLMCAEDLENSLMHYRVGGEVKGRRRWQNKDGSLTPEGYLHYKEMYGWGDGRKGKSGESEDRVRVREAVVRMGHQHGQADEDEIEQSREEMVERKIPQVETLDQLKRFSGSFDIEAARDNINHVDEGYGYTWHSNYDNSDHYENDDRVGRAYNCPNCACAFEMVERGYDVVARRAVDGSNVGDIARYFKGGELSPTSLGEYGIDDLAWPKREDFVGHQSKSWFGRRRQPDVRYNPEYMAAVDQYYEKLNRARDEALHNLEEQLLAQKNGARGIVVVGWMDSTDVSKRTDSYHALNYKVEDGKALLFDTQSSRSWKQNGTDDFWSILDGLDPRELYFMRTDTLELDPSITEKVYSRGKGHK